MKRFRFLMIAIALFAATSASAQFAKSSSTGKVGNGIIVNDCKNYNRLYLDFATTKEHYSYGGFNLTSGDVKKGFNIGNLHYWCHILL